MQVLEFVILYNHFMKNLELLSANELSNIVVDLMLKLQTNLSTRKDIVLQIDDCFFEIEPSTPHKIGSYSILFNNSEPNKKYKVWGYRLPGEFRISELENLEGNQFKSFMFEDLNSKEARSNLVEIINRLRSIAGV